MRRALDEYVISGIKTTLPFFAWLLAQREFVDGAFHTSLSRRGARAAERRAVPVEPPPDVEDVAAIAAALHAVLSSAAAARRPTRLVERRWKSQARSEGLRD